ncbi:hypothetical protein LCGC14_2515900, partial [marine sediment metagenome]
MKKITLLFISTLLYSSLLQAQIGTLASNNWSPIGNTEIILITTDGDNGDGIGDGAQKVNNLSSGTGHGILYDFNGTMLEGQPLAFETIVFNPQISFVRIEVELYNVTDDLILSTSGTVVMTANVVQNVLLNYTPLSSDDGDQLQVRYVRVDDGNAARTFAIDNAQLNGQYLYPEAAPAPSCFDDAGG